MKQVHEHPLPAEEMPNDVKVNEASDKFVELFRRVVIEKHRETG